jgi:hypothetical protein
MVLDSYPFKGTRARPLAHDLKNAHWKTWLGLRLVKSEYHCAQYAATILRKAGVGCLTDPPTPETLSREVAPGAAIVPIEAP